MPMRPRLRMRRRPVRLQRAACRSRSAYDDDILTRVPSQWEVEQVLSSLQNYHMMNTENIASGSSYSTLMRDLIGPSIHRSFNLLQTNPGVQRAVNSLATSPSFLQAVMENEGVRQLISAENGPEFPDHQEKKAQNPVQLVVEQYPVPVINVTSENSSNQTQQENNYIKRAFKWMKELLDKIQEIIGMFKSSSQENNIFMAHEMFSSEANLKEFTNSPTTNDLIGASVILALLVVTSLVVLRSNPYGRTLYILARAAFIFMATRQVSPIAI